MSYKSRGSIVLRVHSSQLVRAFTCVLNCYSQKISKALPGAVHCISNCSVKQTKIVAFQTKTHLSSSDRCEEVALKSVIETSVNQLRETT